MAIGQLDRLVEGAEARDAHDRPERLGRIDVVVGCHAVDDRRVAVDAGVGIADEAVARVVGADPAGGARPGHGVVVANQPEPVLETLGEALVDHRPIEHVLGRVADRRLLHRLREALHELVVDRLVHDHRAERRAALAGRPEAAEERSLDGEVELGVGHHYERVLAAELEAGRLHVAPAERPYLGADGGRAGEADLVDEPLLEGTLEPLERGRAVALDEVEDAVGEAAVDEELGERVAKRRRVLGRLPDDGIAAQDRGDEIPGGHRHREVARGDDRRHAHRVAEGEELLVGHLARNRLAVEAAALADEEVAGVDDLLHLPERLRVRLPDLPCDEAGECLLVLLHEPADLLDRLAADGRRDRCPVALRGAGGAAGVDEDAGIPQYGLADDLVQVRGVPRLDAPSLRARLAAHDRSNGPRLSDAHRPSVPAGPRPPARRPHRSQR